MTQDSLAENISPTPASEPKASDISFILSKYRTALRLTAYAKDQLQAFDSELGRLYAELKRYKLSQAKKHNFAASLAIENQEQAIFADVASIFADDFVERGGLSDDERLEQAIWRAKYCLQKPHLKILREENAVICEALQREQQNDISPLFLEFPENSLFQALKTKNASSRFALHLAHQEKLRGTADQAMGGFTKLLQVRIQLAETSGFVTALDYQLIRQACDPKIIAGFQDFAIRARTLFLPILQKSNALQATRHGVSELAATDPYFFLSEYDLRPANDLSCSITLQKLLGMLLPQKSNILFNMVDNGLFTFSISDSEKKAYEEISFFADSASGEIRLWNLPYEFVLAEILAAMGEFLFKHSEYFLFPTALLPFPRTLEKQLSRKLVAYQFTPAYELFYKDKAHLLYVINMVQELREFLRCLALAEFEIALYKGNLSDPATVMKCWDNIRQKYEKDNVRLFDFNLPESSFLWAQDLWQRPLELPLKAIAHVMAMAQKPWQKNLNSEKLLLQIFNNNTAGKISRICSAGIDLDPFKPKTLEQAAFATAYILGL